MKKFWCGGILLVVESKEKFTEYWMRVSVLVKWLMMKEHRQVSPLCLNLCYNGKVLDGAFKLSWVI